MLSPQNRALVERMIAPDCYRPTDTTFGFTDRGLDDLLNAARAEGRTKPYNTATQTKDLAGIS